MDGFKDIDSILQHHGIKGMHWGQHKTGSTNQNNTTTPKEPSRIKLHLNSMSRERQWRKVLKNINTMSTKDINQKANRIQMENALKRLSKDKNIGSKKDKTDYLNRANMTDQVLSRKVNRLRAKDNLYRNIQDASKTQRELGMRVVKTAAGVSLKYAVTGTVSTKDVANAVMNPSNYTKNLKTNSMNGILDKTNRTILNDGRKPMS